MTLPDDRRESDEVRTRRTSRSLSLLFLLLLITCLPFTAAAQSLERSDRGYVWRHGKEYVRFDRGRWSAGIEGQAEFSWHMFLWHDNWIYETLPGGDIEEAPELTDQGILTMRGTFSARDGSPPVRYAYRITATDEGLRVRCELQKSAALKLTRGVWLHLSGSRDRFEGSERVWFAPSAHGTVSATPSSAANRVLLELHQGRSLALGLPGYRQVENEGSDRAHAFRINLLPDDFEAGETVALEYTIAFADMPERLPGQIAPARQPLAIHAVTPDATSLPQYARLELRVELGASFDNPFDPDDVRLDAVFTSPSGRQLLVPGFFAVDYHREVGGRS
jgi:hypothetical protein